MRRFDGNFGIWLFERTEPILKWNRIVINLVSLAVFGLMIARYGFNLQKDVLTFWIPAIRFFYFIYVFNFVFRLLLARKRKEFVSRNWLETILFTMVILSGISYFIFSTAQVQKVFSPDGSYYEFFLQFMLLILAFIEFIKSLNFINSSKVKPTTLFIASYLLLIGVGTGLLMLPGFNVKYEFLNFFDALFTSTSATCITGLSTLNIGEYFNFKGQVLVLILCQIGGIGILTFASFFATFIRKGLGIKHQIMMNELFDTESLSGSFSLLKRILVLLFGIEIMGVAAMMLLWGDYQFDSFGQKVFYSIFHSVSAFCNAGFSLFPKGFESSGITNLYMFQWLTIGLVILGSLGFPTLRDMFSPSRLRERVTMPWKGWKTSTKISVYTSLVLLLFGTFIVYILQIKGDSNIPNGLGKLTASFFQSANMRSGGMNVVDMQNLSSPLILISMFLMFVGGGSSSLAGGIKTSTFIVIVVAIISTIRGRKEATLGRRTISKELIYRAFAVILFSGNFVLIMTTIMTFTEPDMPFLSLSFEVVSAFGNVGLSMGVTPEFSDAGKTLLSLSMLAGRVGLLTLAFTLSSKDKPNTVRYPQTHIIIG